MYVFFYNGNTSSDKVLTKFFGQKFIKCFNYKSSIVFHLKKIKENKFQYCAQNILTSTLILFSPYTDSPTTMFFVTRASSLPLEMNTPE